LISSFRTYGFSDEREEIDFQGVHVHRVFGDANRQMEMVLPQEKVEKIIEQCEPLLKYPIMTIKNSPSGTISTSLIIVIISQSALSLQ